jgi:predicted metal-dependent TIM-barrel fold hydrolase
MEGDRVIVEPHIHMVSRTTDDYAALALHGVRVVTEPAFWAGFDRTAAGGFADYFEQLTVVEPARARNFGISHYCWLCINPKEAVDLGLAREVVQMLPRYLDRPTVLGIGEIGLNRNGSNELRVLEWQVELAAERGELVLVHTPHLEDKLKGTRLILDLLSGESRLHPDRVLIDHAEEHTIRLIRDRGFWAGITLYPLTKCSPARAVDMLERVGPERIWLNSAADWGRSDPLAVLKAGAEMRRRGFDGEAISRVLWHNPLAFLGQCPRFRPPC